MTFFRHKVIFTQVRQMNKSLPKFKAPEVDRAAETKAFRDVLPAVIESAISTPRLTLPEIRDFVQEYIDHTLSDKTPDVGINFVIGYKMLEKPENITEQSLHLVQVMGWCLELFQSYMFMVDDVLDDSRIRFGKTCWHRLPNVGLKAVNDGFLLDTIFWDLIRDNFGNMSSYQDILDIYAKTKIDTFMGQYLDGRLKTISLENYLTICKLKTTPYFCYFPFKLTLAFMKYSNFKMNEEINELCINLGNYRQIENDYEDVYGDRKVKVGTDIQEGRCSWLAAAAHQRCDTAQRETFDQNYGKNDPVNIQAIKQLFDQLQMPVVYKNTRENLLQNIVHRIDRLPSNRLKSFFHYQSGIPNTIQIN